MSCPAKHTKYQPTMEEFRCPRCGAGPEDKDPFYIQDGAEGSDEDCELLHNQDALGCNRCEYGCLGQTLAAQIVKRKNLVPCSCCKGTGLVIGKVE